MTTPAIPQTTPTAPQAESASTFKRDAFVVTAVYLGYTVAPASTVIIVGTYIVSSNPEYREMVANGTKKIANYSIDKGYELTCTAVKAVGKTGYQLTCAAINCATNAYAGYNSPAESTSSDVFGEYEMVDSTSVFDEIPLD